MDAREVCTQRMRKRVPIGNQPGLARQAMPLRQSGQALHDEELAVENRRVATKEQRLGCNHARRMRDAEDLEFFGARAARRNARCSVLAQDESMPAAPRSADELGIERPVFLNGAARQFLVAGDAHVVGVARLAQPPPNRDYRQRFRRIHRVFHVNAPCL